jgi:hypothetical protein
MCKWHRVIPRHKGSPRYRIAHGWKMRMDLLNLETLKFLMHFREPGSSLYFILILIFFFSSLFLILNFFVVSLFFFFYLLPFEL